LSYRQPFVFDALEDFFSYLRSNAVCFLHDTRVLRIRPLCLKYGGQISRLINSFMKPLTAKIARERFEA
ncbi:MAG: hypothetical protein ABIH36_03100, partial [bacterium]